MKDFEYHGMVGTPEYNTWYGMIARCENPNHAYYHSYGALGITVCERWRQSFIAFYADMGPKPGPEYSIDRWPNNDGNYEPGNCRWATPTEQARNTSTNYLVEVDGKKMTLAELSERSGVGRSTIKQRLEKGVPLAKAIEQPITRYMYKDESLRRGHWRPPSGHDPNNLNLYIT